MNILILYGTTEGQTQKIAEWATKHVGGRGHHVELRDSASLASDSGLVTFHAFIIAASVHQERHQDTVTNFVTAHRELLNNKPSAFVSVSLSAALEKEKPDAQRYVDRFVSVTGWHPRMTLLLGGALRFTDYDYYEEQIVKFIVMKHVDAASSGRDHEFTDWDALTRFLDEFLDMADRKDEAQN